MAVSTNGRFIVSGSRDNTIKLWNIQTRGEECTFTQHTSEVASVAVSADGRFIVSGSYDNTIRLGTSKSEGKNSHSQDTQAL